MVNLIDAKPKKSKSCVKWYLASLGISRWVPQDHSLRSQASKIIDIFLVIYPI